MKDAPEISSEIDDKYNYVVDNDINEDSDDEVEMYIIFLFILVFLISIQID